MAKRTIQDELDRLEKIAEDLKNEDIGLEKSLKLYEEGMTLSKKIAASLEEAELTVRKLSGEAAEETDTDEL